MNNINLFTLWSLLKERLHKAPPLPYFHEGEIWWCHLGKNIGTEEYGKGKNYGRPVLILKKLTSCSCIILPLTSKYKEGSWYFPLVDEQRTILIHQIRYIDTRRLYSKQEKLDRQTFLQIRKYVSEFFR